MLGWIMIGASMVIMSRVADAEDRSPILWGALTLVLCLASAILIPLPLVNIGIGLALSFAAMFALKAIQD